MNGHKRDCGNGGAQWASPKLIEPDRLAEDGLGCGDAQTNDYPWLHHLDFRFQPRPAGGDLRRCGFLVLAALTLRLPLEVLDGVRDVDVLPGNTSFKEGPVENLASRTDKRTTSQVFLISRLLADEYDRGLRGPFAEDGSCGVFVQITPGTAGGRLPQLRQAQVGGEE